eukprot:m.464727 g.464727  ORF g.464727 m.464727 type:complete len:73 (-) comp23701_c0_seq1:1346-1564(-)
MTKDSRTSLKVVTIENRGFDPQLSNNTGHLHCPKHVDWQCNKFRVFLHLPTSSRGHETQAEVLAFHVELLLV